MSTTTTRKKTTITIGYRNNTDNQQKDLDLGNTKYVQTRVTVQPNGYWYSIGSSWPNYVYNQTRGPFSRDLPELLLPVDYAKKMSNVYFYPKRFIYLDDEPDKTKVLKLNTKKSVYAFDDLYGTKKGKAVNWKKVAQNYAGIEFNPYYDLSDLEWYYGLNVPSGVIWNLNPVIKNITYV